MAYDPHLVDLMRQALQASPLPARHLQERRMFGTWCWLSEGHLLCGVGNGRFLFRVGQALEPEALARPGASVMLSAGRRMSGFIWVDADAALDHGLPDWLALAWRCVARLPPKLPAPMLSATPTPRARRT